MLSWEVLEDRVAVLERKYHSASISVEIDSSVRRARQDVEKKSIFSSRWAWVPSNYYDWPLPKRANYLKAPTIECLCKSLLMENKRCEVAGDRTFPKYVLVILQYTATLDNKLLATALRSQRPVSSRLDATNFVLRVASSEDNERLTGFKHNAVSPFGLLRPEDVTVVLAEATRKHHFIWMGGGHPDLKLGMAVSDLVKGLDVIVADVSQPRDIEVVMKEAETQMPSTSAEKRQTQSEGSCIQTFATDSAFSVAKAEATKGVKGAEWKALLENRRHVPANEQTNPASLSKGFLTPEMQAMMDKRRNAEATKLEAIESSISKGKESGSGMSDEVQAAMTKRRNNNNPVVVPCSPTKVMGTSSSSFSPEVKAAMERPRNAGAFASLESTKKVNANGKVVNAEVAAAMERHRQGGCGMISEGSKDKAAELKCTSFAPEFQAAMLKRRDGASDQLKNLECRKDTSKLKGFGLSPEVQAAMNRRKQKEEG